MKNTESNGCEGVKEYLNDIISKIKIKNRKYKVTMKKAYLDDLILSNKPKIASVYVIVIDDKNHYESSIAIS